MTHLHSSDQAVRYASSYYDTLINKSTNPNPIPPAELNHQPAAKLAFGFRETRLSNFYSAFAPSLSATARLQFHSSHRRLKLPKTIAFTSPTSTANLG